MKHGISIELKRLLIFVLVACAAGTYLGYPWQGASLGLVFYTSWNLHELQKLLRWVRKDSDSIPPDSTGICSLIFGHLYKIQRSHQNIQRRQSTVIERTYQSTSVLRDGIILLDKNHRITWWNSAAEHFLGLKKGLDEGQIITHLLRIPLFVDYFQSNRFEDPLDIVSPHNENIDLQLTITLFGNAEYLIFARDITRLHQLERMRQDFVANVSHELRTPLTVIVGYLETLLDKNNMSLEQSHHVLTEMQKQASRMNALVHDLLLLSGLDSSAPTQKDWPVDICTLLESIRHDAEQLMPDKQHSITFAAETAAKLKGNEQELHSAFANLVFNAVKYTPNKGKIQMRLWQDNKGLHFSVSDNGIGIEAKHIPRLTERFYRVDKSRSVATGGTGLGLSITKHVLMRHNAYLEIQSTVGKGSCFSCHFPTDAITVDA